MSGMLEHNHLRPVFQPGRLVSVVLVAALAVLITNSLITNPSYRWDKMWEYLSHPTITHDTGFTLILAVAAMFIGVVLTMTIAIMRRSPNPVLKSVAWFYIWSFRSTPTYTQLIFWGLLSTLYPFVGVGVFKIDINVMRDVLWAAILGLSLNEGAYLAEIMHAGLNSTSPR